MKGSNGDDRFESWELVDDTQDARQSTGLKEEDGDVRMAKAGRIQRCQGIVRGLPNATYMYSAGSHWVQRSESRQRNGIEHTDRIWAKVVVQWHERLPIQARSEINDSPF